MNSPSPSSAGLPSSNSKPGASSFALSKPKPPAPSTSRANAFARRSPNPPPPTISSPSPSPRSRVSSKHGTSARATPAVPSLVASNQNVSPSMAISHNAFSAESTHAWYTPATNYLELPDIKPVIFDTVDHATSPTGNANADTTPTAGSSAVPNQSPTRTSPPKQNASIEDSSNTNSSFRNSVSGSQGVFRFGEAAPCSEAVAFEPSLEQLPFDHKSGGLQSLPAQETYSKCSTEELCPADNTQGRQSDFDHGSSGVASSIDPFRRTHPLDPPKEVEILKTKLQEAEMKIEFYERKTRNLTALLDNSEQRQSKLCEEKEKLQTQVGVVSGIDDRSTTRRAAKNRASKELSTLSALDRPALKRKVDEELFDNPDSPQKKMRAMTSVQSPSLSDTQFQGLRNYLTTFHTAVLHEARMGGLVNPVHFELSKNGTVILSRLGLERAELFRKHRTQEEVVRAWSEASVLQNMKSIRDVMSLCGFFDQGHPSLRPIATALREDDTTIQFQARIGELLRTACKKTNEIVKGFVKELRQLESTETSPLDESEIERLSKYLTSLYRQHSDGRLSMDIEMLLADKQADRGVVLGRMRTIVEGYNELAELRTRVEKAPAHLYVPGPPSSIV